MTRATIYANERHWSWLLIIFANLAHSLRREAKLCKECREEEDQNRSNLRADFRIPEICIRERVTETILCVVPCISAKVPRLSSIVLCERVIAALR